MDTKYREFKPIPYKPPPYVDPITKKYEPYKPAVYRPPPYEDPLKRKYEPYKPSYIGNPYTFTPYKPQHVGYYGEKQRERKIKIQQKPVSEKRTFPRKPRPPRVTYKCYREPMGPDIRLGPMGPEYKLKPYKARPYRPITPIGFHSVYKDPLRMKQLGYKEPTKLSEPTFGYKLTEENYIPFRSWQVGEINDTISAGPPPTPTKKYKTRRSTPIPTREPTPIRKSPKTEDQDFYPVPVPTKSHAVTQTTPIPYIAPVPMVTKHKTKPETPDVPSPVSNTEPMYEMHHTPSSEVPVVIPLVAAASPGNLGQEETWLPVQSKLPPEINAHIEAYHTAHLHGDSFTSIRRTMEFL